AHLHPGPPCCTPISRPCSTSTCQCKNCLNGGRLLECRQLADGSCYCFHDYYLGNDVVVSPPTEPTTPKPNGSKNFLQPDPNRPPLIPPTIKQQTSISPPASSLTPGVFTPIKFDIVTSPPILSLPPSPYSPAQRTALQMVNDFERKPGNGMFPQIARYE